MTKFVSRKDRVNVHQNQIFNNSGDKNSACQLVITSEI